MRAPKSNAELKVTFPQPKLGYSFLTFAKIWNDCDVQMSDFFCFVLLRIAGQEYKSWQYLFYTMS